MKSKSLVGCKIELNINLIAIGGGGVLLFICKFFKKRISFFRFMKDKESEKYILHLVICKAAFEKYKFVKIRKWRAQIGHKKGNTWLKPYKCNPEYVSNFFQDENEKLYLYKFDCALLCMIRIVKLFNKSYSNIDFAPLYESLNTKNELKRIIFYKTKNEALSDKQT